MLGTLAVCFGAWPRQEQFRIETHRGSGAVAYGNPSSCVVPLGLESLLQLTQDLRPGLGYDAPPGLVPTL